MFLQTHFDFKAKKNITANSEIFQIYMNQHLTLKFFLIFMLFLFQFNTSAQGLKASGKKIVDENGNEIILRGMGLGGWMLQEPYMMEMSGFAVAQWDIKSKIQALIGTANTQAFYNAWHANHCTRKDIDSLAAWGFNSVRLPMHYNLFTLPIEEEPVAGQNTWLGKGFTMTDSLINWCKANHMYVILDLHAAPGGQGKDKAISDYNPAKLSLWESEANKQKTIALWRKLAERYANEPWVGGYDLINEPNWSFTNGGNENGCSETSNAPLRQLLVKITNAIREVDQKHIIIIEGNCWGNNYNGIFPAWDNNMVVSFHKYWSYNDQGSIQGILNTRNQYNIPIWLGESGENSNPWFTDAISLVEKNGIGWAWWPMKKIGSVVNPLTITKTDNYQLLLDYWNNGGTPPNPTLANYTLLQIADNAKIQHCIYRKDVIDAMFRQINDTLTIPYHNHKIPGTIPAADYDLGRHGMAYSDTDIATYQVSSGTYTPWNTGWSYRNDGVDIESSTDSYPGSNGYNVGWTADNEWLQYTATVDSTAAYNVNFRYAYSGAGCKIKLQSNEGDITATTTLAGTGGLQTWANLAINDIILYKGQQKLKLQFEKGGANFGLLDFELSKKTIDVQLIAVSAATYKKSEDIYLSCNKILIDSTVTTQGFSCTVNGNAATISGLEVNNANHAQIIIRLNQQLFDIDDIRLNYSDGEVKATDGTALQNFSNLQVKNNLAVYAAIPGKIEAEAFSKNQGLVPENCTDAGAGQDMGYTNAGDYLEYDVRVLKTSAYYLEIRIASAGTAGRLEIQQLNASGTVINNAFANIPVTGGWQTWKTVGTPIILDEGICTLKVKILQPEFNINWYRFYESGTGIADDTGSFLRLSPNPASHMVSVFLPDQAQGNKKINILNYSGSILKSIDLTGQDKAVDLLVNDLTKGLYIVELQSLQGIFRGKLIIR
jgi:hypothetical protein